LIISHYQRTARGSEEGGEAKVHGKGKTEGLRFIKNGELGGKAGREGVAWLGWKKGKRENKTVTSSKKPHRDSWGEGKEFNQVLRLNCRKGRTRVKNTFSGEETEIGKKRS